MTIEIFPTFARGWLHNRDYVRIYVAHGADVGRTAADAVAELRAILEAWK